MNPFFNVEKTPIFVKGQEISNQVAVINSDTNNVLGIVSPKYKIIPNKNVCEIFEEALPFGVEEVQDHFYNNGEMWRRRIILDKSTFNFEVVKGDEYGILVEIFNSYNGKTSYGFSIMGFRWICSNGQIMGKKNIYQSSLTHKREEISIIRDSFNRQINESNKNLKIWQRWTEVGFSNQQISNFLESKSYINKRSREAIINNHFVTLQKMEKTKWAFYNTLTDYMSHGLVSRNKNTSPIFTANHGNLTHLIQDFYDEDLMLAA